MAITIETIQEARQKVIAAQIAAGYIDKLLIKIINSTIKDSEGNTIFDFTVTQKQNILDEYNSRKQNLVDAVGELL